MQKILGIDYGAERIGLAITDDEQRYAFMRQTITSSENVFEIVKNICREEHVGTVVIGLPLDQDGRPGKAAKAVQEFGKKIASIISAHVVYEDERFSSRQASALYHQAGIANKDSKRKLDQTVAQLLLQSYLEKQHG